MTGQSRKDAQERGIADARARFSEMIERASTDGPLTITRHGRKTVIVVAADERARRGQASGSLAEFFAASPLRGSDLRIERVKDGPPLRQALAAWIEDDLTDRFHGRVIDVDRG